MPGFQFFGHEKSRKFSLKQLRKVFNFFQVYERKMKKLQHEHELEAKKNAEVCVLM